MRTINSKLPEFKVMAYQKGEGFIEVSDKDLIGKWSVLFFYPADFTFVCPTELSDLSDNIDTFKELGVSLYSVSTDTHFVHKAWADASSTIAKIEYTMLADPTGHLAREMGVMIEEEGVALRGTFVFNPKGELKIIETNDNGIGRDASELIRKIKAAQFIEENPGMACPAKWKEGDATLEPSIDLVGKI